MREIGKSVDGHVLEKSDLNEKLDRLEKTINELSTQGKSVNPNPQLKSAHAIARELFGDLYSFEERGRDQIEHDTDEVSNYLSEVTLARLDNSLVYQLTKESHRATDLTRKLKKGLWPVLFENMIRDFLSGKTEGMSPEVKDEAGKFIRELQAYHQGLMDKGFILPLK